MHRVESIEKRPCPLHTQYIHTKPQKNTSGVCNSNRSFTFYIGKFPVGNDHQHGLQISAAREDPSESSGAVEKPSGIFSNPAPSRFVRSAAPLQKFWKKKKKLKPKPGLHH
jgi:hypothetical protein